MNIYALSSGRGPSGIAIVRISGKDLLYKFVKILEIKRNKSNKGINYCQFYDPKKGEVIDPEALLFNGSLGLIAILAMIY